MPVFLERASHETNHPRMRPQRQGVEPLVRTAITVRTELDIAAIFVVLTVSRYCRLQ
ncbi:hypothetical protein DPMN_011116 [Dreissena polymorpha]|uniref:Uncharacterized protein n=1 Tax=Dreissena polymorpha TaxID=45954 RepID=A0A9D4RZX5_DREPO|nr:hypothetical protein DPMN_011116 [Dreissena polymorpha]